MGKNRKKKPGPKAARLVIERKPDDALRSLFSVKPSRKTKRRSK
jgi:hypothetical protein